MENDQISKMSKSQLQVKLGLATIADYYKQLRIEGLEKQIELLIPTPRPLCVKCENAESLPWHDLCAECRITELEKQLAEQIELTQRLLMQKVPNTESECEK